MVFFLKDTLELTTEGFTREQSYKIVQKNTMQAGRKTLLL